MFLCNLIFKGVSDSKLLCIMVITRQFKKIVTLGRNVILIRFVNLDISQWSLRSNIATVLRLKKAKKTRNLPLCQFS